MKNVFFTLALVFALVGLGSLALAFTVTTVTDNQAYSDVTVSSVSIDCGGADAYTAVVTLKQGGKVRGHLKSWTDSEAGTKCEFVGHAKVNGLNETCASNKASFETAIAGICTTATNHADAVLP